MSLLVPVMAFGQFSPEAATGPGRYKAVFTAPAQNVPTPKMPDGPLAGNGDIGLTIGGTPDHLTFYFGKNDFWRAYPVYPGGGIALPGGLDISIAPLKGASYYAETLFDRAVTRSRFKKGDLEVTSEAWVTATHNAAVITFTANQICKLDLGLWAAKGNTATTQQGTTNGVQWVTRSFENTPLLEWPSHVAIAIKSLEGTTAKNGTLTLRPGQKQTFVVMLYTNLDDADWKNRAIREAGDMDQAKVGQMHDAHVNWWKQRWERSQIAIGDTLLEKYYYASQYLFASASRGNKMAPGLWGPFITRDSTAWGGDYHLNYNYQAPYWAAFSSNYVDLTDNFDQPLLDYMEKGRQHAKELLHIGGLYYPVGIGPKGICTTRWPLTPEEMQKRYGSPENTIDGGYKFLGQKINAVFSAANMFMRFYSTYDEQYARKVYPFLIGCADFWEDYLRFENGRYVIVMDHFNEVMPNLRNKGQWRDKLGDFNSNLSLGLVKMLFKGLYDMSGYLQTDTSRRNKWAHIVNHISDFPTGPNPDGHIALKNTEQSPVEQQEQPNGLQRVSIHGLLLPGAVTGPVTDPAFNQILLNDIRRWQTRSKQPEEWGNTLGNGIETVFPGAARVGYDADSLLGYLKARVVASSFPNLLITQAGGGVETLSAVPLTIHEMLMQSYEGVIRVFPNWNRNRNASFRQLRAYGAFLVSSELKDGRVTSVKLYSEKGRPCQLINPWPGKIVQLKRNGRQSGQLNGDRLFFDTGVEEVIELNAL